MFISVTCPSDALVSATNSPRAMVIRHTLEHGHVPIRRAYVLRCFERSVPLEESPCRPRRRDRYFALPPIFVATDCLLQPERHGRATTPQPSHRGQFAAVTSVNVPS